MTVDYWEAMYQQMLIDPRHSEIIEHLPTLREYASKCESCAEIGVHDGSTSFAMMMGRPEKLISVDIKKWDWFLDLECAAKDLGVQFTFLEQDSLDAYIPPVDLLFIDSFHSGVHLSKEIGRHIGSVRKYLICHDTEIFGKVGEDGSSGLWVALEALENLHPEWRRIWHHTNNNGLTAYSRWNND